MTQTLYVDADAIVKIAKELIIKTANRAKIKAIFVANGRVALPPSPYVSCVVVAKGFDVADNYIVAQAKAGDVVVTSDIPLAFDVLKKGAIALNARGEIYSTDTIAQKVGMRDFMDTMRGTGVLDPAQMGTQKPYSDKDKKRFADALNKVIKPKP